MTHPVEGRFRKRPVVVEAIRVDSAIARTKHPEEAHRLPHWLTAAHEKGDIRFGDGWAVITTLEGEMFAKGSDYIIRGVKGELYSCRGDIFDDTYEHVI